MVRPVVREFGVHVGACATCGRRMHGRHPLQTSDALGAAAVQLGPEVAALVVVLHQGFGPPLAHVVTLLRDRFGIRVTRGALVHVCARTAAPATADTTVYAIRPGRGFGDAATILGEEFAGVLTRDGWAPYRRFVHADHQTCLAQLLRRAQTRDLLTRIPAVQRFVAHLTREASALFTFLGDPAIDATHWRAEHAIRPAVVMRKVCGGPRNARGAQTQPVLASVLRTAHLRGLDPSPILVALVRAPRPISSGSVCRRGDARPWRPAEWANRQTPVGQDPAVFERGEQASSPKRPIAPKGV